MPHINSTKFESELEEIFIARNIATDCFSVDGPTIDDPIGIHATFIHKHILSIPYPNRSNRSNTKPPRARHGILHACRVAYYVQALYHLMYVIELIKKPTALDIKLLQIVALLHDSARVDEKVDIWENESTLICYGYFTRVLKLNHETASFYAQLIYNKDLDPATLIKLNIIANENSKTDEEFFFSLENNLDQTQTENTKLYMLLKEILHDADCLDVRRVRYHFEGLRLYVVSKLSKTDSRQLSLVMEIIADVQQMLYQQGDLMLARDNSIKATYETDTYNKIIQYMRENQPSHILSILYNNPEAVYGHAIFSPGFSELPQHQRQIYQCNYFFRGTRFPEATIKVESYAPKVPETFFEKEVRKINRYPDVPTRARTPSKQLGKNGNPNRSVGLMVPGSKYFSAFGLILKKTEINAKNFVSFNNSNIYTGFGKKEICKTNAQRPSDAELYKQLVTVYNNERMGGHSSTSYEGVIYQHTETIANIFPQDVIGIGFTFDPCVEHARVSKLKNYFPHSNDAILLSAIYIQKMYERQTGVKKPLIQFSGLCNTITEIPAPTEDEILSKWKSLCSKLFTSMTISIASYNPKQLTNPTRDEILIMVINNRLEHDMRPIANQTLSDESIKALDEHILQLQTKHVRDKQGFLMDCFINKKTLGVLSSVVINFIKQQPKLFSTYSNFIANQLESIDMNDIISNGYFVSFDDYKAHIFDFYDKQNYQALYQCGGLAYEYLCRLLGDIEKITNFKQALKKNLANQLSSVGTDESIIRPNIFKQILDLIIASESILLPNMQNRITGLFFRQFYNSIPLFGTPQKKILVAAIKLMKQYGFYYLVHGHLIQLFNDYATTIDSESANNHWFNKLISYDFNYTNTLINKHAQAIREIERVQPQSANRYAFYSEQPGTDSNNVNPALIDTEFSFTH